ncbi:hypothetical protein SCHPADRAFT_1667 [Schizopora paradoxa]|uniref:F-box domain-containing protein n=1 Tax=Schizopora paradoxa TaxID=27342 RepID=A0A0H2S7U8_9AGAM|nr:hypothetical protein SCHPADRAFT_1667 [Schizopora paradoxa]
MDLPEIVIEDIADIFNRLSWKAIFAYNSIVTTNKSVELRNESRDWTNNLLAMSLAHRSWTNASQRVMRRRVNLHSYSRLLTFSQQKLTGTHVRCLSYVYTPQSGLGEDDIAPETHWKLLADVLTQCPNIHQLSIKSSHQFLSKGVDYKHWCRDHHAQTHGISLVYPAIKGLVELEALVFDVDLRVLRRSSPFPEFCTILPHLQKLRYLQAMLWRDKLVNAQSTSSSFPDRPPPPSLKKIVLHLASSHVPTESLKWLLRANGEYRPDEVIFHRMDSELENGAELHLRLLSSAPFASAHHARFIYEDNDSPWHISRAARAFAYPIANLFSSLLCLEVPWRWEFHEQIQMILSDTAKSSIESLTLSIDSFRRSLARAVDDQFSTYIECEEPVFSNLRQFRIKGVVSKLNRQESYEDRFPRLVRACARANISFNIEFDTDRVDASAYTQRQSSSRIVNSTSNQAINDMIDEWFG